MCQPIAQPPLANLKNITAYGAVAGGTDNTTAIQNACTAAGSGAGTGIFIPAGTFYHSGLLTLNCNIYGQGASSELYCPNPIDNGNNCVMYSTGSNEVWSNFSHQINTVGEVRDATNLNIYFDGGSNNRTDTLLLIGGSGGIQNIGTTNDIDTNNGIFNTKADCNYHTGATTNGTVDHTYVYNCGDDSVSNVSYNGQPEVNGTLVQWNSLNNGSTARGISSLGSTNETFQDNLIQNIYASGIYIAQENPADWNEGGVSNVIVRYNYLLNNNAGNPGSLQGGMAMWSGDTAGPGISNIQILGNYAVNTASGPGFFLWNSAGATLNDVSYTNNTVTGTTGIWGNSGTGTNTQCTGNTYNGTSNNSGGMCVGTNPSTATGSPVTYSGCVVGTAKQYTGPITISGATTIKAVAVFPGLTNSSVASGTY